MTAQVSCLTGGIVPRRAKSAWRSWPRLVAVLVLVLVTALLSSGFDTPAPLGALFGC